MDSINKNQPEKNHKDLVSKEAVEKIKELIEKAPSCFFCTNIKTSDSFSTRPMSVQKTDDNGNLFFLSASDSHKNKAIKEESSSVRLLFQGSEFSNFLDIYGDAEISTDKALIKDLWQPILKTWFTEGENDPRITVIKVAPQEGYYWDTKHGAMVSFIKKIAGALTGQTLDDSIEGKILV